MILVAGFLAFNGGTQASVTNPGDGAMISKLITNTIIGGSGGSIAVLLASKVGLSGKPCWSFINTLNGGFIGMV